MTSRTACALCQVDSGCTSQANFNMLIISDPNHDANLVEARMFGVSRSAASKVAKPQSQRIDNKQHSDYWLTRFLASCGKLRSTLARRPRAKTDLEALPLPLQRSNTK